MKRRLRRSLVIVLLATVLPACATMRPMAVTPPVAGNVGIASWYGEPFHGRLTANGERYNMHELTAAHRLYVFGTRVRVTNLENGRSVIVRINDRGPFVKNRIIDLSFAAATAIGMVPGGTTRVRLDRLPESMPVAEEEPAYTVQVAAFQSESAAHQLRQELGRRYADVFITSVAMEGASYYRVRVGRLTTIRAAEETAARLSRDGFTPFVTRQDPPPVLR